MQIRRLISKLNNKHFFSLAGNGLMSVFAIATMWMLFHFLPDIAEVGNWVFFQTVYNLVDMFRTGFLTTATIKFYSGTDKDRGAEVIGSCWVLATLITAGLMVLNVPALLLVGMVKTPGLAFFLKWFGLTYLLSLPTVVANCVLQAEGRFDRLLYMRAVTQGSFLLSMLLFVLLHHFTLEAVVISNLLSYFAASVFVLIKGWAKIGAWRRKTAAGIKQLYDFGKYSVGGNISSYLLRVSDIFIIGFMFPGKTGEGLVAIYNFGLRLLEIVEIPLRSFVATAMPSLATAYNKGNKAEVIYIMKKYAGTLTMALIPVAVISVCLADIAVYIIGGPNLKGEAGIEAANVLRLFMTFALLFPTDRFLALSLDVIHKPDVNFVKILIMLAANVTGDIVGILVSHSIYGVAITTVFPTLIAVFIGYRALRKYEPFHLRDIYATGFAEAKILVRNTLKFRSSVS